jgi:hypothetical protein
MKKIILFVVALAIGSITKAQLSGDLQINQNFYILDSSIFPNGNVIPPQYYQQLSSTEGWLTMNYRHEDYTFGVRYDLFQNSGLRNPQAAYNGQGLGYWFIQKKTDNLDITAGYFYDQFGSGVAFRAYEQRGQNLDYAIMGMRIKYQLGKNWSMKAFSGKQKFQFSSYQPALSGVFTEKMFEMNDHFRVTGYASVVNRIMDNSDAQTVLNNVNLQAISNRFDVRRNAWVYTGGTQIQWKDFSFQGEANFKTREAMNDNQVDTIKLPNGGVDYTQKSILVNKPGSVVFGSLSYSKPGLGITAQYKRTDHFDWRTSPNEILNNGLVAFLPPIARMNTYRLTSRYAPATQLIGEQGAQIDIQKNINKKNDFAINIAQSTDLRNQLLYREVYVEMKTKFGKNLKAIYGIQYLNYNFGVYQKQEIPGTKGNTSDRLVKALTPYVDVTYKFNRKQSMRMELSHMGTHQDLGSWWWGMLEYNVAPKYSFSIMDMWNYGNPSENARIHYYTIFGAINFGHNRLAGGYVKQVQGVVCNGGVCRVEPAFNGFRFTLTSTF